MSKKLLSDELIKGYTTDSWGHIRNAGKFEGEHVSILYWYENFLNGGDTVFEVTPEERTEFGYDNTVNFVYLAESEQGFCSLEFYETQEQAESRQDQEWDELFD